MAVLKFGCVSHLIRDSYNDPYRRVVNAQYLDLDRLGFRFIKYAFSVVIMAKLWLQQVLEGQGLLTAAAVVSAQALLLLIRLRPQLYVRHREAFMTAAYLPLLFSIIRLASSGAFSQVLQYHGGNTLRLLLGMLLPHPAFWVFLSALYGRLVFRLNCLILPGLTLAMLFSNRAMCEMLLEVEGTAGPLAGLYNWLDITHNVPLYPLGSMMSGKVKNPLEQCTTVNAWLTVLLGVLLALLVVGSLESKSRAALYRRQQQRSSPTPEQQERQERQEQQERQERPQQIAAHGPEEARQQLAVCESPLSLPDVILASCFVWFLAWSAHVSV